MPSLREAFATKQSSLFKALWIASLTLAMTGCSGYKTPSLSGEPSSMSADTLCYRAAYAKSDAGLQSEITARHLDCGQVMESRAVLQE